MNIFTKLFVTLRGVANHPLNRSSRVRAMRDFCVAQVAVRMMPGDICVAFPNQTKLLISPRMKGAAHFISPGLCEFEEMAFVVHFLRPDDLFVDIGANVGAYTLLAAGVAGAKAIAFEPSPSTFGYLQQNVRLNGIESRVRALNLAAGSKEGVLELTEGLGTENYVVRSNDRVPKTQVKVATLDRVIGSDQPALIKIDVEGFETEALAGAGATLANPHLQGMIIERARNGDRYGFDEAGLHERIRAMSFTPCAYVPASRSLQSIPKDALGNIIYVRDLEFCRKRLREAPSFRFSGVSI